MFYTSSKISLEGNWRFSFDPQCKGISESWFNNELPDIINLPGTTEENKKGDLNTNEENTDNLTRLYPYTGIAWYQKEFEIPEEWRNKQVLFFIERTKKSSIWIDDQFISSNDSLATPHLYEYGGNLVPGIHKVTVMEDNLIKTPAEGSHQLSDHTQTNWNGLLGRIEIRAVEPVRIEEIQIYTDIHKNIAQLYIVINNFSGSMTDGAITLEAESWNNLKQHKVKQVT
jgi:hypothetical protein